MARQKPPPWSSIDSADNHSREAIDAARQSLAAGNPRDALREAGRAWSHHRYLREAYEIAGDAALGLNDQTLAESLKAILGEPHQAAHWLKAGWALVDQGASDLAITLLEESNRLEPTSTEIRESLVIAYSDEGRHLDVVELASGVDLNRRPALAFPLAWSALMIRRQDLVDRAIWALGQLARKAKEVRGVYAKAATAVERYKAHPPEDDVRHWHFVQYGGLTIDVCTDVEATGGRYSLLCPDYEHVARVLVGLLYVLDALDVPTGPWGYLGRDGEILARALAGLSGKPAVRGVPGRGWLVLSDPREVEYRRQRQKQAPNGNLRTFSFGFPWTMWGPRVVEATGLWAEVLVLPWNGGWRHTEEHVEQLPRDWREPQEIAAEVVQAATRIDRQAHRGLVDFATARRDYLLLKNAKAPKSLPYVPDAPLPESSLGGVLT
jgi:tetratricopeptide (TPR) repeat protein